MFDTSERVSDGNGKHHASIAPQVIRTPQIYSEPMHSHARRINNSLAIKIITNPSLSSRHDETCNFAQMATMTHEMAFRGNSCVNVKNVMVVAVGPCGIKSLLRLSRRKPMTPLTTFS
jgi:hypothetical protein